MENKFEIAQRLVESYRRCKKEAKDSLNTSVEMSMKYEQTGDADYLELMKDWYEISVDWQEMAEERIRCIIEVLSEDD